MAIAKRTPRAGRRATETKRAPKRKSSAAKSKANESAPAKKPQRTKAVRTRTSRRREVIDEEALLSLSSEELVRRWLKSRRTEWRDAVVERHLPDVVDVARSLGSRLPRSVDIDDLCNAGYSGLLRCLRTFDSSKGRSFVSYMRTRIYGAMVDELRAMDWLPRLMRSRIARRDEVFEELRQELGRDPNEAEVAKRLGISVEAYRRTCPPRGQSLPAGLLAGTESEFDRLDPNIVGLGVRGRVVGDEPHPLTSMYQQELIVRIQDLCSSTEWRLVELHYFEGLKLREVADRLELSPARICQLHMRVLQRLRERLREEAATI